MERYQKIGNCYEIPITTITETEHRTDENRWKFKKYNRETFENLKMVLTKMFENVVDPVFHSSSRGLATKGFITTPPVDILANI